MVRDEQYPNLLGDIRPYQELRSMSLENCLGLNGCIYRAHQHAFSSDPLIYRLGYGEINEKLKCSQAHTWAWSLTWLWWYLQPEHIRTELSCLTPSKCHRVCLIWGQEPCVWWPEVSKVVFSGGGPLSFSSTKQEILFWVSIWEHSRSIKRRKKLDEVTKGNRVRPFRSLTRVSLSSVDLNHREAPHSSVKNVLEKEHDWYRHRDSTGRAVEVLASGIKIVDIELVTCWVGSPPVESSEPWERKWYRTVT